jgi:hypothetical protein
MPFNGSGTFNRIYSWATDAANGLFVDSTRTDTDTNDIASGLTNCVTKDGQTTLTASLPMAGFKLTGLGIGTSDNDSARVSNANAKSICEFRLTLTTGVPVTTADVTAVTTLYWSPYKGNRVALYDGTNWNVRTSAELSKTNAGIGGSVPTDIFCFDNAGTPTLESLQWTNDTTRATALVLQDGVLVKSGATTRRYLGTIRATAGGAFTDSYTNRWVWNYYNRVLRPMRATEATATWTYTSATWEQARASTANQLDFVVGWAEDAVTAQVQAFFKNTNANVNAMVSIGLDSTSAVATGCLLSAGVSQVAAQYGPTSAQFTTIPAVGRHFLSWLEISDNVGTTTWGSATGVAANALSGIHGWVWA